MNLQIIRIKNLLNLILLFAASFLVFVDFFNAQTITPLYLTELGGTEFHSGLQSTVFLITAVILRFYFGPLADRRGNKIALIIGTIAFASASFLFLFSDNIWYVITVRMYQSIGLAAYLSSASSLTSALAPRKRVGTYIGLYRLVIMTALMVGPTSALYMIDLYSYGTYNILGAIIGIVALIFILFIKEPRAEKDAHEIAESISAKKMLKLIKDKKLSPVYLSTFILGILYGFILTFTAIYIGQETNVNPGIFFTLFGVGSIVANLVTGTLSDRLGRSAIAYPCMALMGMGSVALYFLPSYLPVLYLASVFIGFGYAGGMTPLLSWNVDVANINIRTTSLAVQESCSDFGMATGSFVFGLAVLIIGMPLSFATAGMILIIFAMWKISNAIIVNYADINRKQ